MRKIKIFVASSKELEEERKMIAALANSLNTALEAQDIQVIAVEWENLDASMGLEHKQEEYNTKIRECEMCVVLYATSFGVYTKEEFDVAHSELIKGNNPQKLYVYFKDGVGEPTPELKEFRDSFPINYGHFYTQFNNVDTLKAHFLLQFINYQNFAHGESKAVELRDGKVLVGGKEYVSLQNVPFAGNNEKYTLLNKSIKRTEKLLSVTDEEDPEYAELVSELNKMKEDLENLELGLWETALQITKLSSQKCSDRFQRAVDYFNKGDNKGAAAILNEEEIYKDAKHNISLVKLGEEGRKNLLVNIDELLLKIDLLQPSMCSHREVNEAYEIISAILSNVIEYASVIYGENSKEVLRYCRRAESYLREQVKRYLPFLEKALEIAKRIYADNVDKIAWIYRQLIGAYLELGDTDSVHRCHMAIIDLKREKYGEHSEQYIDAIAKYADDLRLGCQDEAKFWYEKALSLCREINYVIKEKYILYNYLRNDLTKRDWNGVENIVIKLKELSSKDELLTTYIDIADNIARYSSRAITYYEEALSYAVEQNNADAQRKIFKGLSEIYRDNRLNDADKQIEYLNKALEVNSSNDEWDLYDELTNAYLRKEDYLAAKESAQKCLDIANALYQGCGQSEVYRSYKNLCKVYQKFEDLNSAIETLLKLIELEKRLEKKRNYRLRKSYIELARLYNKAYQEDKALEVYASLIDGNVIENLSLTDKVEILQFMGWTYRLKEDLSQAEKCYKDAIALCLKDRPDEKWANKRDIVHSNTLISVAYFQLAWFYAVTRECSKAQEALDKSHSFCKEGGLRLLGRPYWQGVVYRGNGEYQKAVDIFKSIKKGFFISEIELQTEIALTLLLWGKPNEAIDIALKVVAEDPNYEYAHEVLGRIYKERNDYVKAKSEFETCLALREKECAPRFAIREVRKLLESL